jgi:hypothetical protein
MTDTANWQHSYCFNSCLRSSISGPSGIKSAGNLPLLSLTPATSWLAERSSLVTAIRPLCEAWGGVGGRDGGKGWGEGVGGRGGVGG